MERRALEHFSTKEVRNLEMLYVKHKANLRMFRLYFDYLWTSYTENVGGKMQSAEYAGWS